MEKEKFKDWMEKYSSGKSTLDEEASYVKDVEKNNENSSPWFMYLKEEKKNIPTGLNERVWDKIQKREKKNKLRKLVIGGMSIAASLLLLFLFFKPEPVPKSYSLEEKQALLKEAMALFENDNINKRNKKVLYEDDIIIIYASK